VPIKMVCRLLARLESIQAGAIYQEDIQPSIVVVVEQGDATACGFEDVFLRPRFSDDGLGCQTRSRGNVDKVCDNRPRFEFFCGTEVPGRPSSGRKAGESTRGKRNCSYKIFQKFPAARSINH